MALLADSDGAGGPGQAQSILSEPMNQEIVRFGCREWLSFDQDLPVEKTIHLDPTTTTGGDDVGGRRRIPAKGRRVFQRKKGTILPGLTICMTQTKRSIPSC